VYRAHPESLAGPTLAVQRLRLLKRVSRRRTQRWTKPCAPTEPLRSQSSSAVKGQAIPSSDRVAADSCVLVGSAD
jgi:hypothetical protein